GWPRRPLISVTLATLVASSPSPPASTTRPRPNSTSWSRPAGPPAWPAPPALPPRRQRTLNQRVRGSSPGGAHRMTWDYADSGSFFVPDLSPCWLRARSRVSRPVPYGCQIRSDWSRPVGRTGLDLHVGHRERAWDPLYQWHHVQ